MIHDIHGFDIHSLFGELIRKLPELQPEDPLKPLPVIVPNMDVARWLRLHLAAQTGISAHIDFVLPAEWMYRKVREQYPDLPTALASDKEPMMWTLYQMLSEKERALPTVLQQFMKGKQGARREQAAIAMARQLASVFDQYQLYRPGMLLRWQRGTIKKGEEWQAGLWSELCSGWTGSEWPQNRAELFAQLPAVQNGSLIREDEQWILFHPGLLPKPVVQWFSMFRERGELWMFRLRTTAAADASYSHPLLRAMGSEAQQAEQQYRELANTQTSLERPQRRGDSLLNQIQYEVWNDQPSLMQTEYDGTVQIRSCHNERREVETLFQFLLHCFDRDESLQPDDVLVCMPDLQRYRPIIHAVFGVQEPGLPLLRYHIAGERSREEKSALNAFIGLLNCADSTFSKHEVLELFREDAVREAVGLSLQEQEKVLHWIDENNVQWGWDAAHREQLGQPPQDEQTWMAAMGRLFEGQWSGRAPQKSFDPRAVYESEGTSEEYRIWSACSSFLLTLNRVRMDAATPRPLADWADLLKEWLEALLGTPEDATVQIPIRQAIESLEEVAAAIPQSSPVSYRVVKGRMIERLQQQGVGSAAFSYGITFSSMVPVRGLSRKIVAVLGLHEGEFPRKTATPDYDLLAGQPEPGDRDRKREDRALFLESVLSARNIHYCSYIGRDEVDDEPIALSPVILEWAEWIADKTGQKPEHVICQEPLHHFSSTLFSGNRPHYSQVSHRVANRILEGGAKPAGLYLPESLQPDENGVLSVYEVEAFLKNPLDWFLSQRFDARLSGPSEENEEFSVSALEMHILFRKIFFWTLRDVPAEAIKSLLTNSGVLPMGWPGEQLFQQQMHHVELALQALKNQGFSPVYQRMDVNVEVGGYVIRGVTDRYADDCLLDFTISDAKAKYLLPFWFRHLLHQANGFKQPSWLLTGLRKGDPKWIEVAPVDDWKSALEEITVALHKAKANPPYMFPETMKAYLEGLEKGEENARKKAESTFFGSEQSRGEADQRSIQYMEGTSASLQIETLKDQLAPLMERALKAMRT
ncbi:MAG: exodeoxyribonuclease V subunit gamma [Balneolaceae bacterium]